MKEALHVYGFLNFTLITLDDHVFTNLLIKFLKFPAFLLKTVISGAPDAGRKLYASSHGKEWCAHFFLQKPF